VSGGARAALLVAALSLCATPARAHQEPYSHLEIVADEHGLHGTLTAHMVDLAHEAGLTPPESLLSAGYVAAHRAALDSTLTTHLVLRADGVRVRPRWGAAAPVRERRSVRFEWDAPAPREPGTIELQGPLFPYDPPHQTYVNVFERGTLRRQALLDASERSLAVTLQAPQPLGSVVARFVAAGVHHIFIGPDHILFVLGLLLLGGSVARLLKIVTAFTVAHTVTLVLAALRIVNLPSRIVEPAIAVSIIVVGVDALRSVGTHRDRRAAIAFGFGFVHGFGFASVLRDFGLPPNALGASLASFNVGVEIGQACIVLAAAPLLAAMRARRPSWTMPVVTGGALVIVAAGAWWLVQRTVLAPA
jgi:hydrogenase/urease accessory protein HupE